MNETSWDRSLTTADIYDLFDRRQAVETLAPVLYRAWQSYALHARNTAHPKWKYLREDLQERWRRTAREILNAYDADDGLVPKNEEPTPDDA